MVQLGSWLLRLLGNKYVGGTMVAVGVGSQLPSAEGVNEIVNSSSEASKQWKSLIGATALLFAIILFATPIRSILNNISKKLR